jgi:TfoX/Sxy family transcriptional regulator of competence genes
VAYDEDLAARVDALLGDRPGVTTQRMFGGLAFLVNGNMAVAVRGQGGLLVRVDPADHDDLLAEDGAETMVMRGRPMRGWLTVATEDVATWAERGFAYAAALPAK